MCCEARGRTNFQIFIDETVLPRAGKFRYVLYFTVSKGRNQSINIVEKLLERLRTPSSARQQSFHGHRDKDCKAEHFVVDVVFESQDHETAAIVEKYLRLDDSRKHFRLTEKEPLESTHTVFGYISLRQYLVRHSILSTIIYCWLICIRHSI